MEVIRNVPADRPLIQRYRGGGFTISGIRHEGAVLVLPGRVMAWTGGDVDALDPAGLLPLLSDAGVDLCLFGCGERMKPVPRALRDALKGAGIGVDSMATGAASRTFNMLVGEGRSVAAVLMPVT